MWLFLFLQWCFLLVASVPCNFEMPKTEDFCEQTTDWKVNGAEEAQATCLEYFPTTFVKGSVDGKKAKCKVDRQFQCDFITEGTPYSMFDKCYTFSNNEMTMDDYLRTRPCKAFGEDKGSLPIFLTMTQAKHIAMRAYRERIKKIWVNVDQDGKTIEDTKDIKDKTLLYKEPFKLHKGHYWTGEKLNVITGKEDEVIPKNVNYMFFRSKTDHWNNLIQGSFERATGDSKASIVCEYKAKIVPDTEKYCEKMKKLGLNAGYSYNGGKKLCVYSTLTHYPLKGTISDIKNFKGCGEKPSGEHSSGIDFGSAASSVYSALTSKGTFRVAAIKKVINSDHESTKTYAGSLLEHCKGRSQEIHRLPFRVYDHFFKEEYINVMTSSWAYGYPKDECSDFPNPDMYSNTLAIREGKIIDVPTPVPFPMLCSIGANVDCELNQSLCTADKKCLNVRNWNSATKKYAECKCAEFHTDDNGKCKWYKGDENCGMIHAWSDVGESDLGWARVKTGGWLNVYYIESESGKPHIFSDNVDRLVVRYGCTVSVYAHPQSDDLDRNNFPIVKDAKYGDHIVPLSKAKTSNGLGSGMDASAITCTC